MGLWAMSIAKKNLKNNNLLVTIKVHSVPFQLLNSVLVLFCPVMVAADRRQATIHPAQHEGC